MKFSVVLAAATLTTLVAGDRVRAQDPYAPPLDGPAATIPGDAYSELAPIPSTTPEGDALSAFQPYDLQQSCASCSGGGAAGGGSFFNRCGCNTALFPYIQGPGRCDDWCVGPHWQIGLDGLVLTRDANNWNPFTSVVGVAPQFTDTFDVAPGARLFATGYNAHGFGMQVGYEGVNNFTAFADYAVGPDDRAFAYKSNYNSVEINFIPSTPTTWHLFGGVRYIEIDDRLTDALTVAKTIAPPSATPTPSGPFTDTVNQWLLDNRLIGVQLGTFRDSWALNRWLSFEGFANAGAYLNNQRQRIVNTTNSTVFTIDDTDTTANEFAATTTRVSNIASRNFTSTAFAGEAGAAAVLRLNPCFAVRAGYQIVAINRLGLADQAFFTAGPGGDTLVYHGLQFGAEYRR